MQRRIYYHCLCVIKQIYVYYKFPGLGTKNLCCGKTIFFDICRLNINKHNTIFKEVDLILAGEASWEERASHCGGELQTGWRAAHCGGGITGITVVQ